MTTNIEIWKDVVGYEEYFQISNHGRLLSKRTNKILKQRITKSGYCTVATKIGGRSGKAHCFRVHRLVADAFLNKTDPDFVVNHIDGNKLNNHLSNLEWVSISYNNKHSYDTGLRIPPQGDDNTLRKLSNEQVAIIRQRRENGESCRSLGREYDISHVQISRITRSVSYKT